MPKGDSQCLKILKTPIAGSGLVKKMENPVSMKTIRETTAAVGGRDLRKMNSLGSAGGGSKAFKYSTIDDYKTAMDAFENEQFSWQNERYIPFFYFTIILKLLFFNYCQS